MKKDRNYMPYPTYPMNPMTMNPMMSYPNVGSMVPNPSLDIENIQGQINMLDRRVSDLEAAMNKSSQKYNTNDYHVM